MYVNFIIRFRSERLSQKTEFAFRHQECATCECYLGYVSQLKIDSDQDGQIYIKDYKPDRDQIHACLGCAPCAPSILYTTYLRKKTEKTK